MEPFAYQSIDDINNINEVKFQETYWIDKFNFIKIYNEINIKCSTNNSDNTGNGFNLVVKLLLFFNYIKEYPTIVENSVNNCIEDAILLLSNLFRGKNSTINQIDCNNSIPIKSFNSPNDLYCIKYKVNSYVTTSFFPISNHFIFNNNNNIQNNICINNIYDIYNENSYYCEKYKLNGIKVLTSFDITTGKINFISKDIYNGSKNDFNIAIESEICERFVLKENERILSDFGFIDGRSDKFICTNIIGSCINNNSCENDNLNETMGGYEIETPVDKVKKSLKILNQGYSDGDLDRFERIINIILNIVNLINCSNGGESIIKSKQVILKGGQSSELMDFGIENNPITSGRRDLTSKVGPRAQNTLLETQSKSYATYDKSQSKLIFNTVPNTIVAITQVVKSLPTHFTEVYVPPEDPFANLPIVPSTNNNDSLHYINNCGYNSNNLINNNDRFTAITTSDCLYNNICAKGIPIESVPKVSKTSLISNNSYFKIPTQSNRFIPLPNHVKDQRKFLRSAQNNLTFI